MSFANFIALIEETDFSSCKVAGICLRDRLIKGCIAEGLKNIYILGSSSRTFDVTANEMTATVTVVTRISDIPEAEANVFYIRDNIIIRDTSVKNILASRAAGQYLSADGQPLFMITSLASLLADGGGEKHITLGREEYALCQSRSDVPIAEKRLFTWLYKPTDGIVTQKIDRPISRIFSRYFARFDLPPAVYTYINGLQAVLMLAIFFSGHEYAAFLGCMMYQVIAVFDCIDGEIARAKYQKSAFGAKLDTGVDMMANIMFMVGLSYLLWMEYGTDYMIMGSYILGLVLSGISLMILLLYYGPKGGSFDVLALVIRQRTQSSERLGKTFTSINYVMKRDFFALFFAILGMSGQAALIPYSLIVGLIVWNLAILYNAKSILKFRY